MSNREIAEAILSALGGHGNIRACGICATRLRIIVRDMSSVELDALMDIRGVLGIFKKGCCGIELVLGPRLVIGVSEALFELTGIRSSMEDLSPFNAPPAQESLSIRINTSKGVGEKAPPDDELDEGIEDDLGELLRAAEDNDLPKTSLLVINGPNINMLGIREPELYGSESYQRLLKLCEEAARDAGFDSCTCMQSNHEGDLIDCIQQARGVHDAIVINPAAYTHTSVALLDALKAVQIPAVEVHISDVDAREEFRRISYVRTACIATISGHGVEGYREAIELLAGHLGI